jgi:hypothetical protein
MKQDTLLHPEQAPVIQALSHPAAMRLALAETVCHRSVAALNEAVLVAGFDPDHSSNLESAQVFERYAAVLNARYP